MSDAILGRDAPVVRPPARTARAAAAALPDPRGWRMPRVRALLSVANREGIAALARDLRELRGRDRRHRRHARIPRRRRRRGRQRLRPDPGAAARRRPGQDLPPAVYAGILARRDVPDQLAELEAQGIGLIDLVVVNVKPFAPAVGAKLVGLDEAIEMIDVGGAALLGAAARNAAGVAAVADPAHYPTVVDELRRLGHASPELRATPGGRGVQHGRRLSRRDRRLPEPDLRQHLPEPAGARPREGRRPALRREPAPAGGVLPRDDAPQRRRSPTPASSRAAARRSTTCSTSMRPTASPATTPRRRSRSSSTPTRSGWRRTTSSSRPTGTRSRPIRSRPSAASSGSTASSTGRPPARSPPTRTRRSSRPSFSDAAIGILRGQGRLEILAVPPDPDRRDARLRHRQPRLQARRGRPAGRGPRRPGARSRPPAGRHPAPTDARGADRPAVRVARRPSRAVQRDHPRPQRRDRRHRRRPGVAPGVGRDRAPACRRPGQARGHGIGRVLPVPGRHPGSRPRPG